MSGVMTRSSYFAFAVLRAANSMFRHANAPGFARKDTVIDQLLGADRRQTYNSAVYKSDKATKIHPSALILRARSDPAPMGS